MGSIISLYGGDNVQQFPTLALPLKFPQEILNCFAVNFLQIFILHFCHFKKQNLTAKNRPLR